MPRPRSCFYARPRSERRVTSLFRGWWDRFRQEIGDVFTPIVQRAQKAKAGGATIERKWDPDYVFDEHPLADGKVYSFLQDVYSKVITPLEGSGFTQQALGDYLMLNRVLNETAVTRYSWGRSELANPRGETPATARKALMEMRVTYGAEAMEQLENLGRRFPGSSLPPDAALATRWGFSATPCSRRLSRTAITT